MIVATSSIIKKLLLLFLIFSGLYYAKAFLMPLAIGIVLATLFLPFCKWMETRKVPKGLSVTLCLLLLVVSIGAIASLLGWQISELTNDFALTKRKVNEAIEGLQKYIYDHWGI